MGRIPRTAKSGTDSPRGRVWARMHLMTSSSFNPGAMRGAVDLSSLGQTPPGAAGSGAPAGSLRVEGTEANFQELVVNTREVAALFVLWSAAHPESEQAVEQAVAAAATVDGRMQVVSVEVDANPGIAAAFQVQQLPMTIGVIAAQPVPLFPGVQPAPQLTPVIDELLTVAAQNGVTGRVSGAEGEPAADEDDLPPLHAEAFDAIEKGDYAGARAAYEKALAENPGDPAATAGVAQVGLLERLEGIDPAAVRAAAAEHPEDVDAAIACADLDIAGGHVEDGFSRLIDVIRATREDERDRARTHLLSLFEVIGATDPRVTKARRSLMSALF